MNKRNLITILGFVLSILFLYLSLRGIRIDDIWQTLKRADVRFIFLALLLIGTAVCGASFRWAHVAGATVHFRDTFTALLIGLFINNVLPARIGELARGYALSRKKNSSFTYALSTVMADRFFDLTGLLLLTFIFFPKQQLPSQVSKGLYLVLGLLFACIVAILVFSRERFVGHLSSRLMKLERSFLTRFARTILDVQENLKRITSPLLLILFVAISFGTWFLMSCALYAITLALGVSVPFRYVPFVCALLNMGITVPSSPGYVGLYQFLLVYLLSLFGVPKHEGFAASILYHASWYIPYTVAGFVLLVREHLRVGDIKRLKTTRTT